MGTETINNTSEKRKLSYAKRVAELSVGLITNKALDSIFNYLLYPFVIYKFGILKGGVVMTILSFLTCIGLIKLYDWSKRDWLGMEAIKKLKEYEGDHKVERVGAWALQKGDPVVFLSLSLWYDHFITTTYMRHGSHQYNGMSKRDWAIFISSLLFSNGVWIFACYTGISLVEWTWKVIAR